VSAVLDDERFAAKAPNIRQRFKQHVGSIVTDLFHAFRNLAKPFTEKGNQNSIARAAQSIDSETIRELKDS
jgi:hypothetical protein